MMLGAGPQVKSLSPDGEFVIALHSPSELVETGLRISPQEKNDPNLACGA
jgi:hypothetical protein